MWPLALALIAVGALLLLGKGKDIEEATLPSLEALRGWFSRRSSVLSEPFPVAGRQRA